MSLEKKIILSLSAIACSMLVDTSSVKTNGISKPPAPYPVRLENRIKHSESSKDYLPDKYALLVRGDDEPRHEANFSKAYQVLLENGFQPQNMFILTYSGYENFYHPVDDVASGTSLKMIMNYFIKVIDERDLFFVYLNGHGDTLSLVNTNKSRKELSTFHLRDGSITEEQLGSFISSISPKQGILLFGFCFSGGFAERLGQAKYCAISDTKPDTTSSASTNDSFDGYFLQGLSPRKIYETDRNRDSRISLEEALYYAKRKHSLTRLGKQVPVTSSEIALKDIFIDNIAMIDTAVYIAKKDSLDSDKN